MRGGRKEGALFGLEYHEERSTAWTRLRMSGSAMFENIEMMLNYTQMVIEEEHAHPTR